MSTVVRRLGQGRPKATNPMEDRYLTINALRHRDMTVKELARNFSAATGKTISRQTDDNTRPNRANFVKDFLHEESRICSICRMGRAAISPDLNPVKHVLEALGRVIVRCQYSPNTRQKLKFVHIEKSGDCCHKMKLTT
ncbi:hypothetical protein TNCV_1008501 [Trichonephila clavipes]|nr:hypothetical protein TNCV_1008501 [Trichonephila clavipes]